MGSRIWALLVATAAWVAVVAPGPAGAAGAAVVTYSVRGQGNVSDLEAFAASAAATYADPRGWNLGGSLRFERVDTGGDFTLWLSSNALMPTFGGACDVVWSCRNGRNVVVNEDRWLGASEAVLAAGGTLAQYRTMVVNHETGHWLGFGHSPCAAAGQPAHVMQQQSMDLAACTFNPWPLESERAIVAANRQVPLLQAGAVAEPPPTGVSRPTPLQNTCLSRLGRAALRPWTRCL
jgi:hypothetical protein